MCVALQSPRAAKPENYHATMDMLATHYSPGLHQILQYTLCMHALSGDSNSRLLGVVRCIRPFLGGWGIWVPFLRFCKPTNQLG